MQKTPIVLSNRFVKNQKRLSQKLLRVAPKSDVMNLNKNQPLRQPLKAYKIRRISILGFAVVLIPDWHLTPFEELATPIC